LYRAAAETVKPKSKAFGKAPLRRGAFSLQAYSTTPRVVGIFAPVPFFVFVCGVGHRQGARYRATLNIDDSRRCAMSKSEQLLRDDLDCLRLACDLTQLASNALSPALKSYLLQLARTCTSLVDRLETRH
jgi:hypothetical protein